MGLRAWFGSWIAGTHREVDPLPGRPPAAPAAAAGARGPTKKMQAICCSGGGIRAAAFSLGGIQGLQGRRDDTGRSWYDRADLISAVSGGSYLAGSLAMVNRGLSGDERCTQPPYAVGSPEDNRLRNHTRYLIEDPKVAALGALSILYGLLLNLLPILAGIYVAAKLLGLALDGTGILVHDGSGWQVGDVAAVVIPVAAVAALGVLAFAAERLHDVYRPQHRALTLFLRAWSLRLLELAAFGAAAFLGVPFLLHLLTTSRLDLGVSGASLASQWGTFVATTAALVGLVKATLGRFRGKLQTSSDSAPGAMSALLGKVLRAAAPWAGSAVVVLLLLAAFLTWTSSAAFDGLQAGEYLLIAIAVLGTVAWQGLTDINRNSVHPFYKERLSTAFAVERKGTTAAERPYEKAIRFSGFTGDRPELVVCAAVNTDEEGRVPSGRGCAPFTFSPRRTGISSGTMFAGEVAEKAERMLDTEKYEQAAGPRLLTLPAAVAVSGAAVSPVMGRMTRAPFRLLLGVANVRLGLWLPNPARPNLPCAPAPAVPGGKVPYRRIVAWQFQQPGIRHLLREILGSVNLNGRWIYVTDGGHYENLGLVEALRRGATEIVAFDASGDPPDSWVTFGEAVQTARADLGVEIDLDPSTMRPAKGSDRAPTLVVKGTCTYPDGQEATLLYCKLALPEKASASWDVYAWKSGHAAFPNDSTLQQLYGDREFEAYRRLGQLAAEMALDELAKPPKAPPAPDGFDVDLAVPALEGLAPMHIHGVISRRRP